MAQAKGHIQRQGQRYGQYKILGNMSGLADIKMDFIYVMIDLGIIPVAVHNVIDRCDNFFADL